jgi:hypothetical protein
MLDFPVIFFYYPQIITFFVRQKFGKARILNHSTSEMRLRYGGGV